ncbi:Heat-labile enterotoxin IIB, A chain [Moelleriella libera RCEF 2490]|uniref:Heat-labile enterotoxin IIB, A chain n=1 Tax=Moelleriella libera RCEF 2490 TaxID=1081109 RepID=A0A168ANT3_9HYPO|nr:Heat-labile enterotoxin IIB, A chain [Moelleriella libera RCEF 2490]
MTKLWMSLALWAAAALVSSGSCGSVLPPDAISHDEKRAPSAPSQVLFRGEYGRTPQQVVGVGGLMSKGYARNFEKPLTTEEKGWGSSLVEHVSGTSKAVSLFVSTTSDPSIALKFATGGETPVFYIYEIAPDKKAIDVEKSLVKFGKAYAATQKEFAFVKGIPMKQIIGHYVLKPADYQPTKRLTAQEFKKLFAKQFVPNAKFDKRYLSTTSSGKQAQFNKFYTGPTTPTQNKFVKEYVPRLKKEELQTAESAAQDLVKFFEKASPGEQLLDSSRPNWPQPKGGRRV